MVEDARGQLLVQVSSGSCCAPWYSQTWKCVTVPLWLLRQVLDAWLGTERLWEEVPGCSGVPASVADTCP